MTLACGEAEYEPHVWYLTLVGRFNPDIDRNVHFVIKVHKLFRMSIL